MDKRTRNKKRILSLLLALAMVLSSFAGAGTNVAKANSGDVYEPIEINSSTLNASTVWGKGDTSFTMDADGGFFSRDKQSDGAFPNDGKLTTTDGVPYQLKWTGDTNVPYAGNDSIRFVGKRSGSYVASDAITMKISTYGVYDKLCVLGTAGGFSDNTKSLNFTVTLTYTDKTTSKTTYSLYDWYKSTSYVDGYAIFKRLNKNGTTIDKDYGTNGGPMLQSKQIECDETKVLEYITFQIANTASTVANEYGIYAAIYAVTGMLKNGAPDSPNIAVQTVETDSFTVVWDAVDGANAYAVDVSEYPTFQDEMGNSSFVGNYVNYKVNDTSIKIEGLSQETTYYCRVRAIGSDNAQSRSSENVWATTEKPTPEEPTPGAGETTTTPTPTPGAGGTTTTPTPTPRPGAGETTTTPTPMPGTGGTTPTPTPGAGGTTPTPTPGAGGTTTTPTLTPGAGGTTPTPTPGAGGTTTTPTPGAGGTTPTPGAGGATTTPTPGAGGTTTTPTPGAGGTTTTPTPGAGGTTTTPTPEAGGTTTTPTPGAGEPTTTPTPGAGGTTTTPTPGAGGTIPTPTPGAGGTTITPSPEGPTICSHNWEDATCTAAKICDRCGETEGEALGHDWSGKWTVIKEATATEEGKQELLCARGCGQKKMAAIPATGVEMVPDDKGNLEKNAEIAPEAPIKEATLDNQKSELVEASGIFTEKEKEEVEKGAEARVWLEISKTNEDGIVAEDKAEIKKVAEKAMGEKTIVNYFDADLFKQVGMGDKSSISEPGIGMKITIKIPENLQNHDKNVVREYKILRLHDGVVDVIDGIFDALTGEFSFESDKFSTYAIAYTDTPVEDVTEPEDGEDDVTTPEDGGEDVTKPEDGGDDVTKPEESDKDDVPKTGEGANAPLMWTLLLLLAAAIVAYGKKWQERHE